MTRASLSLFALLCLVACDRKVVLGYAPDRDSGVPAPPPSPTDAAVAAEPPPSDAAVAVQSPPAPVSWPTGVHTGNELERYESFAAWRGRPIDVALFFVDRTVGWPGVVEPGWPVDMLAGLDARLILALPLYPEGEGDNSSCAGGAYDEEWRKLGPFLIERGRGDSIIRLGWGPNDSAHDWRADDDPTDWITCFRRTVEAIRSTGPELEIVWDFNPAGRPDNTALEPFDAYPGDAYVDFVGLEAFDRYPPALDEASLASQCESPTGLCSLFDFAREHGKRIGLSEWGLISCGDGGGGDNPFYVRSTFDLFAEHADLMGFEAYYEDSGELCSALQDGDDNRAAAAEYRSLYGPR
ncbi:MAG: hypothetical protein OXT09_14800 [Myxococcales bacterium]|nr:hypothetical protein [Myxococcales bacterium]